MIYFCPTCHSLCALSKRNERMVIWCRRCPFEEPIKKTEEYHFVYPQKEVDNFVYDESEAWKSAARTDAKCPKCGHDRAYFNMVQIRSGDEGMSTFYRCCNEACKNVWRED